MGVVYEKLRTLTLTGHGGEMEKDFKKFLCKRLEIPDNTPQRFMPSAKMRCEGLQMRIREARKKDDFELEVKLCKELFITREAVGAVRGGKGLAEKLTAEALKKVHERFAKSDSFDQAIREIVADPKQRDAALSGHGGAFKESVDILKNQKEAEEAMGFSHPTLGTPGQAHSL